MPGLPVRLGLGRILAGGLTGLAALLGPALLDLWASHALEGAMARVIAARLGAKVTIGQVQALGPTRLRLHQVRVTWTGEGRRSLEVPRLDLGVATASVFRLRPALAWVRLPGGRFNWEHRDVPGSLERLARRFRGAAVKKGGPRRGRGPGPRLEARLDEVRIRQTGARPGHALSRLRADGLLLGRAPGGAWRVGASLAHAELASGARLELRGLSLRGLERGAVGPRLRALRVESGRWRPPGPGPGRVFALLVDELAPDLLQVRLDSPGSGSADRLALGADLDLRKRTMGSRLVLADLRLGSIYPWPSPVGLGFRGSLLRGSVALNAKGTRSLEAKGSAALTGLAITHSRLAPSTVRFDRVSFAGKVRWDGLGSRLSLSDATLSTGRLSMRMEGELRLRPRGGRARIVLDPTGCQALFGSLPAGLVPTLHGLHLKGDLGGELIVAADAQNLDQLTLEVVTRPNTCQVVKDSPRANLVALRRPFTFLIRPPGWAPTRLVMGPEHPDWVPYIRLGRNVIGAFLAAEDRRFFEHRGFDLENIRRALGADLKSRGFAKGASSISQQVVKNVFLSHRRTLSRKLEEAILTWRMEQVLEKRRILEIYLNLVEMGPGLFGVRAAALHYFQKEPSKLDPLEAAHLAAITPSPQAYFERFREGRAGMDWLLHLRYLLYQMHRLRWLDKATYERARTQDLRLLTYGQPKPQAKPRGKGWVTPPL